MTDCTEEALMSRLLPSGSISLSALSPMLLPLTRQVFNIWLTLEEREDMAVNILKDTRLRKGVKRKDVGIRTQNILNRLTSWARKNKEKLKS